MSTSRKQTTAPGAISRQQSNRSVEEQNLERLFGTNSEDEHEKSETDEPNSVEEVNDEPENTAPNVEEIEKELAEQLLNLNLEETDMAATVRGQGNAGDTRSVLGARYKAGEAWVTLRDAVDSNKRLY